MKEDIMINLYNRKVTNLGTIDIRFDGIFSPLYEDKDVKKYMTGQFTDGAADYTSRYTAYPYWNQLILNAISKLNIDKKKNLSILDIGSGSGNTIVPLLDIFPDADIIASDLSIELLVLLKKNIRSKYLNVDLLQLNAEELDFKHETFDMITGGAILHHLINPEKTIEHIHNILKKGGCAIFFEPFENGHALLEMAYREILSVDKSLSKEVRQFLKGMAEHYNIRKGSDKSSTKYDQVDDKWLFTKSYFMRLYEKYEFSKLMIYPIHDTRHQFENQTITNLRLGLNNNVKIFPDWAWEILRKYDNVFSEDMKQDMLIEGCITFIK